MRCPQELHWATLGQSLTAFIEKEYCFKLFYLTTERVYLWSTTTTTLLILYNKYTNTITKCTNTIFVIIWPPWFHHEININSVEITEYINIYFGKNSQSVKILFINSGWMLYSLSIYRYNTVNLIFEIDVLLNNLPFQINRD